jgi:tetratricopeptide (TPR) repeat protein
MKKGKVCLILLAGLIGIALLFPLKVRAENSAYKEIFKIIHDESYYSGCPKCRNIWDDAFAEVEKGSSEWEKLVEYYSGCLMEEHKEIEAISLLQEALKTSPRSHRFFSGIGTAYMRMQDDEKAEEFFLKSNAIKPNRDAYYKLAFIHYKKGARMANSEDLEKRKELLIKAEKEINETIKRYEARAVEAHVSAYASITNLGLLAGILEAQGRIDEAISTYRRVIDISEKAQNLDYKRRLFALTEFKFSLGQLLYKNSKREEGVELMREAINICPTENLRRVKEMLFDLTIHPAKSKEELRNRYPQLKDGSSIPLY